MWAFWGHLTLQKCIPICLAFLRKILFRDFFTQRIIPPPFLLVLSRQWMSYSLRLSSEFRISLWSPVSTSNTKSRPITVSGARLCKYYVNTCLLKANKLHFMKKKHTFKTLDVRREHHAETAFYCFDWYKYFLPGI